MSKLLENQQFTATAGSGVKPPVKIRNFTNSLQAYPRGIFVGLTTRAAVHALGLQALVADQP
jgi:hypothetical protein